MAAGSSQPPGNRRAGALWRAKSMLKRSTITVFTEVDEAVAWLAE
jgi:hypothetical protein